jgi:hypothetical protein
VVGEAWFCVAKVRKAWYACDVFVGIVGRVVVVVVVVAAREYTKISAHFELLMAMCSSAGVVSVCGTYNFSSTSLSEGESEGDDECEGEIEWYMEVEGEEAADDVRLLNESVEGEVVPDVPDVSDGKWNVLGVGIEDECIVVNMGYGDGERRRSWMGKEFGFEVDMVSWRGGWIVLCCVVL